MTLKELAATLKCDFKGDANFEIKGLRDIERLEKNEPEANYIYFLESKKFLRKYVNITKAGVVLTSEKFADSFSNVIVADSEKIRLKFIELLTVFEFKFEKKYGQAGNAFIDESAQVDKSALIMPGAVIMAHAKVGANVKIYPNAVVEPYAEIGDDSILYPCSVVGHHCILGKSCILFACAVVGADGFGYHGNNPPVKIPQIGNVVCADFVEIGANSSVDRATIETTFIDEHTKLDDQVHIGHNCHVGKSVFVAGNAGISGSVTIGDRAIIAGQAGLADHITIGEGAIVMALTGVPSDLEGGKAYFGIPAREVREMHKINSALVYLPQLLKRVKELESKLS